MNPEARSRRIRQAMEHCLDTPGLDKHTERVAHYEKELARRLGVSGIDLEETDGLPEESTEPKRTGDTNCAFLNKMLVLSEKRFDLVVLGAGPVGVKAAVEASARGQRVALVDPKGVVHGAPTGVFSKCAREAVLGGSTTWEHILEASRRAMEQMRKTTMRTLRTHHVDLFRGKSSIANLRTVSLSFKDGASQTWGSTLDLDTDAIIVATGGLARRLPPADFSQHGVYDSDTIASLPRLPKRLVVQGGGIIGLEYAVIFAKLGVDVVVVELADKLVAQLDQSLQEACRQTVEAGGIQLLLCTSVDAVKAAWDHTEEAPCLSVRLKGVEQRVVECDCFLSAVGRQGNLEGLGLKRLHQLGLKIGRGRCLEVDQDGYTGIGRLYAAGDVAGAGSATAGQAQAVRAIRKLYGSRDVRDPMEHKPTVVWTIPEMAWVGVTEAQARSPGRNVDVAVADFKNTIRGCITAEEGFLKLVYDRSSGKVLGVHIFGENACELVNYGAEVVNSGDTIFDVLRFVFPAVTYHMLYHKAATEAKTRLMGAKHIGAKWRRVMRHLSESLGFSHTSCEFKKSLRDGFAIFDVDKSGFISHAELKEALARFGMELTDTEVGLLIEDASGQGKDSTDLDYEDFIRIVQTMQSL